MEAQTGKILTVVNQDWGIRQSFKPCSTIKLVTGVAGVSEKLIDQAGNVRTRPFPMNLDDALAYSNNSYFQVVGRNLGSRKMISYAQAFGLGQPTGINADGETSARWRERIARDAADAGHLLLFYHSAGAPAALAREGADGRLALDAVEL